MLTMCIIGYGAESDSGSDQEEHESDDPLGLIGQAKALLKASKLVSHRCQHPKIRFVLPRFCIDDLEEEKLGNPNLVLKVFKRLKALGVSVQMSDDLPVVHPIKDTIKSMVSADYSTVTDIVNLDTTVLLALVSDISNGRVDSEDWHHEFISIQIELEKSVRLLSQHLWPSIGIRDCVCTREAYDTMQTIIDSVGTETEKRRCALLFERPGSTITHTERLAAFQSICEYTVPDKWRLPIQVIDIDLEGK